MEFKTEELNRAGTVLRKSTAAIKQELKPIGPILSARTMHLMWLGLVYFSKLVELVGFKGNRSAMRQI